MFLISPSNYFLVIFLSIKVKDLTIEEFQALISASVRGVLEELLEDIQAFSSDSYLQSIVEARQDYKEGKVKSLEDLV